MGDYSVFIPLSLQTKGHDVRTMIPKYGFVSERKYILREVIRLREIPFDFDGQEVTRFETSMGGLSLRYNSPSKKFFMKWLASAFYSKEDETYDFWEQQIIELSKCDNVIAKLGGIAMEINGFNWHNKPSPPTGDQLINRTKRY